MCLRCTSGRSMQERKKRTFPDIATVGSWHPFRKSVHALCDNKTNSVRASMHATRQQRRKKKKTCSAKSTNITNGTMCAMGKRTRSLPPNSRKVLLQRSRGPQFLRDYEQKLLRSSSLREQSTYHHTEDEYVSGSPYTSQTPASAMPRSGHVQEQYKNAVEHADKTVYEQHAIVLSMGFF